MNESESEFNSFIEKDESEEEDFEIDESLSYKARN